MIQQWGCQRVHDTYVFVCTNLFVKKYQRVSQKYQDSCYITYVWPISKYALLVLDICTLKYMYIYKKARSSKLAHYIFSDYRREISTTYMMQQLSWPKVHVRWSQAKAMKMYTVENKQVTIPEGVCITNYCGTFIIIYPWMHTRVTWIQTLTFSPLIRIWDSPTIILTLNPSLTGFRLIVSNKDIYA